MDSKIDTVMEAAKATPPASILGLTLAGVPLDQWVIMGSALLIALQIFFLLREKVYLPWKAKRNGI